MILKETDRYSGYENGTRYPSPSPPHSSEHAQDGKREQYQGEYIHRSTPTSRKATRFLQPNTATSNERTAEAGLSGDGEPKYGKLEPDCGVPHRLGRSFGKWRHEAQRLVGGV